MHWAGSRDGAKKIALCGREESISFLYDPDHPVMSHGAESMLKTMEQVGSLLDQPDPGYREDVVSFFLKL